MTLSMKMLSSPLAPALMPLAVGDNLHGTLVMVYVTGLYNAVSTPAKNVTLLDLQNEKYSLRKPIYITLKRDANDEYIACFDEASLARSGETANEAIDWLKSSIVSVYDSLKKRDAETLGRIPAHQLKVLGEYLGSEPDSKT